MLEWTGRVEPDWIDYNGHMNVAYYHMAFDHATDRLLEHIGLGADYVKRENGSMFALEDRLTYQRELRAGDPIRIAFQMLDYDDKRMHYFQRMFHVEQNYLAATCEHLSIYVDMTTRRSAPFPDAVKEALIRFVDEQGERDRPEEIGRLMGLKKK